MPHQASPRWVLVRCVRRDGGFEPTLKVKVPVGSGEAPVSMSTSAVVLTAPKDGGIWGEGDTRHSENGRGGTVNMSELLKAVHDCSIDFPAQLFACEAFLSSPE